MPDMNDWNAKIDADCARRISPVIAIAPERNG